METPLRTAAVKPRPFYRRPVDAPPSVTTLPYDVLKGPGFERLIYELLWARGEVPHYFGHSGQKQFGVDLVVESAAGTKVYQCKNVTKLKERDIKAWLSEVEKEWLGRKALPKPQELIICCPLDFSQHLKPDVWERESDKFRTRTKVPVTLWNVHYLDRELRERPEIVASVFSDHVASVFTGAWKSRLWMPVDSRAQRGSHRGPGAGQDAPTRYFRALAARQLQVSRSVAADFRAILADQSHLMIRGPAGVGKSVTGLALASRFAGYRFRLYYSTLKWTDSAEALVQGCIERCTLPTIFFLDDCDQNLQRAEVFVDGVMARLPKRAEVRFILVKRGVALPASSLPLDLERRFADADALLDLHPNRGTFEAIVRRTVRHDVDEEDLDRLWAFTGGDLYLLGQIVSDGGTDLKALSVEAALRDFSARYFREPSETYPVVREIASLAQFEIVLHVGDFPAPSPAEKQSLFMLATTEQEPQRYVFVHSSAAELVFRALAQRSGVAPEMETAAAVGRHLETARPVEERAADLHAVLSWKRKLPPQDDAALIAAVLEKALPFVGRELERIPAFVLGRCVELAIQHGIGEPYLDLLESGIEDGRLARVLEVSTSTRLLLVAISHESARRVARALEAWVADPGLVRSFAAKYDLATFVQVLATVAPLVDDLASRIRSAAGRPFGTRCGGLASLGTALANLRAVDSASADVVAGSLDLATLHAVLVDQDLRGVASSLRHVPRDLALRLIATLTQADLNVLCERMSRGAILTLGLKLRELDRGVSKALCYAVGTVRFARMTAVPAYSVKDLTRMLEQLPKRMRRFVVARVDEASFRAMFEVEIERPNTTVFGLRLRTVTVGASSELRDLIGKLMCEEPIVRAMAGTATLPTVLNIASYSGRHFGRFLRAIAAVVPRPELARRRHSATDMAIRIENGLRSPALQDFFAGAEGAEAAVAVFEQIREPGWVNGILRAFRPEIRDAVFADAGFRELVPTLLRSGPFSADALLIRNFGDRFSCDLDAARSALRAVLAEADWPSLNRGMRSLAIATSPLADIGRAELLLHVSELEAGTCDNWIDEANRRAVSWTLHPDDRDDLREGWKSALPPEVAALRTPDWIATLPPLAQTFVELSDEAAGALLACANDPAAAEAIPRVNTFTAFGYLWTTYSLAIERGKVRHEEFAGWLSPALANALQSKVALWIQKMRPWEVEPCIALRRLLRYVGLPAPDIPLEVRKVVQRHAASANGERPLIRHFFTRGLAELGIRVALMPVALQPSRPSRINPAIERLKAQEGFRGAI